MFHSSDDKLWIISVLDYLGAERYDYKTQTWDYIDLKKEGGSNVNISISETKDGSIWITSHSLIQKFSNNKWTFYKADKLNLPNALYILKPLKGDVHYLVVRGIGIYKVDLSTNHWFTYEDLHFQCETKDGTKWFLERNGNVVAQLANTQKWVKYSSKDGIISDPNVIFVTKSDEVWGSGSHNGTAATMRLVNGKWEKTIHPELSSLIDYRSAHASESGLIYFGAGGTTWESKFGGLKIYNPQKKSWQFFPSNKAPKRIAGIVSNSTDSVWLGGRSLQLFNGENASLTTYTELQSDWIDHMIMSKDKSLWVSKGGEGIFKIKNGKKILYTIKDGLAGNITSWLMEAKDGTIWAATNSGISRFDGNSWMKYALPDNFNIKRESGTLRQSKDGTLWINQAERSWFFRGGGDSNDKINDMVFKTTYYRSDVFRPETHISFYDKEVSSLGNTTIFWKGEDMWGNTPEDQLQFSYKIDNEPWSAFTSDLYKIFLDLSSGHHLLLVRSRDRDFNVDPTPAKIEFRVLQTLWLSPVFIFIMLLFTSVIIYLITRIIRKNSLLNQQNFDLSAANDALLISKNETERALKSQIITELNLVRTKAEKIHEMDELKLSFFTNISHEIKTPLTLIMGPLQTIISEAKDLRWDDIKNKFSVMMKNAERLHSLVIQLLDIRKIEAGKMSLQLSNSDIVEFLRTIISSFEIIASEHSIKLELISSSEKLLGWFDADKMEKIMFNLLSNAFKYTPSNGSIVVTLEDFYKDQPDAEVKRIGTYVEISVKDTGSGIPPKEIPHVFEKYHNVENNRPSGYQGTGIGLFFTKQLVEMHDGSISLVDSSVDGTIFKIKLPLSEKIIEQNADQNEIVDEQSNDMLEVSEVGEENIEKKSKQLILIIEDNKDMCEFIASVLDYNYNVEIANDGQSGINAALKYVPDLIISDISMPNKDGYEVCAELKKNEITSHIPIILLTAKNTTDSRVYGLEVGADAYISKPFYIPVLIAQIENLLTIRKTLQLQFSKKVHLQSEEAFKSGSIDKLLKKAIEVVEDKMSDPEFDVNDLVHAVGTSKSVLFRKLKSLTNLSISDFIKSIRLKKAYALLSTGEKNVTEVSYEVGFRTPNYFISCFKEEFKITPKQFSSQVKSELANKTNEFVDLE